jgi:hypothetical protein
MTASKRKGSGTKGREGRMGSHAVQTKSTRNVSEPEMTPQGFGPELQQLCDEYLRQGIDFAKHFVTLAKVSEDQAPTIEEMIVGGLSVVISQARISVFERR